MLTEKDVGTHCIHVLKDKKFTSLKYCHFPPVEILSASGKNSDVLVIVKRSFGVVSEQQDYQL